MKLRVLAYFYSPQVESGQKEQAKIHDDEQEDASKKQQTHVQQSTLSSGPILQSESHSVPPIMGKWRNTTTSHSIAKQSFLAGPQKEILMKQLALKMARFIPKPIIDCKKINNILT